MIRNPLKEAHERLIIAAARDILRSVQKIQTSGGPTLEFIDPAKVKALEKAFTEYDAIPEFTLRKGGRP